MNHEQLYNTKYTFVRVRGFMHRPGLDPNLWVTPEYSNGLWPFIRIIRTQFGCHKDRYNTDRGVEFYELRPYAQGMRFVLDTNVLIAGFQDEYSADYQLLDAAQRGTLTAVVTHRLLQEYRAILNRAVSDPAYRAVVDGFLAHTERVRPAPVSVVIDDPEDRKVMEAARGGAVDAIVTSDRHLLDVGEVEGIPVLKPVEALTRLRERGPEDSEWQRWVEGLHLKG